MANPIQKAVELRDLLNKVLDTVNIAPNSRKKIEETIVQTTEIISTLEHINEYVELEVKETLSQSLNLWNQLNDGYIKRGDAKLEELIENSATLDTLTRAGVEIRSVAKFSDLEFELAKEIGDNFESVHWALQKFKSALQAGGQSIKAKVIDFKKFKAFLKVMQRFDIISDFETEILLNEAEDKWAKFNQYRLWTYKKFDSIRFNFAPKPTTLKNLITGNWFNAYAYQIISKHLKGNRFNYELFTRVAYQAPRDIIRSDGDFDIIGKIENHLLFVECKSGKLVIDGNYEETDKIIEKTEDLQEVFKESGADITEFTFLLIYNPMLDENKNVPKTLSTNIQTVKPFEIRGTINGLFKK